MFVVGRASLLCSDKFQEEFGRATLYSLVHEFGHEFVVKHHDDTKGKTHIVFRDGDDYM